MGFVAEFFDGLEDALARLFGDGPRPVQGIGDGADGHSGAFGDARHGGHRHPQSTVGVSGAQLSKRFDYAFR